MVGTKRKRGSSAVHAAANQTSTPATSPESKPLARREGREEEVEAQEQEQEQEQLRQQPAAEWRRQILVTDENQFRVKLLKPQSASKPPSKRRRVSGDESEPKEEPGIPGASNLRVSFTVSPNSAWSKLTKYRNFVVNPPSEPPDRQYKFQLGEFVFVNYHTEAANGANAMGVDERKDWVAQVCEVRAVDSEAVFVRVAWMYYPEELPSGKETYHGKQELVASNLMDIIDAMTVDGKANVVHVKQGFRDKDRDMAAFGNLDQDTFYWRQTFNAMNGKLSSLPKDCECKRVSNLDERLFQCPHGDDLHWYHEKCLTEAALEQYSRSPKRLNGGPADGADRSKANGHAKDAGVDDGGPASDEEIRDTIIARERTHGASATATPSSSGGDRLPLRKKGMAQKLARSGSKSGNKGAKATARKSAAETSVAAPMENYSAKLVVKGGVFTGRAEIRRVPEAKQRQNGMDEEDENEDDDDDDDEDEEGKGDEGELVDTIEVYCIGAKCGKSMAAERPRAGSEADKVEVGFDAVRDAISENSTSRRESSRTSGRVANGSTP